MLKCLLYLESHSKNIFGVSWSTQDGHADNILSEVYGAISVLDRIKETAIKIPEMVNAQIIMMDSALSFTLCGVDFCLEFRVVNVKTGKL